MKRSEYEEAHKQLVFNLNLKNITWDEFKQGVKDLDNHAHEYERNAYNEKVCWCGASQ